MRNVDHDPTPHQLSRHRLALFFALACLTTTLPCTASTDTPSPGNYSAPSYTRDETQSYYEPGISTQHIVYNANHLPLLFSGEHFPADMIVASDVGTHVARYSAAGEKRWILVTYPATIRAINLEKNRLIAFAGAEKLTLDIANGHVLKREPTGSNYLFYKKQGAYTLSGLDEEGKGTVFINKRRLPIKTSWARDALIHHGKLYVSDTHGQRVLIFNAKTLKLLRIRPFYFPNDLLVAKGQVMVVEEHANRIIGVDDHTIPFSCPLWFYTQTAKNVMFIEPQTKKLTSTDGVGRCAREFMGPNTLYSANGAAYRDNTYVIADTDNHRVIAVRDGSVVSELLGVNNPVRVILLAEDTKP